MLRFTFLDPEQASWAEDIHSIRKQLGAPHNPQLFPDYFLQSTFAKIGGKIASICRSGRFLGAGFFFPRAYQDRACYTLRLHVLEPLEAIDKTTLLADIAEALDADIVVFDPNEEHAFEESHLCIDGIDIGRPNREEAVQARELHRHIWQADEDNLYPIDIHSPAFALGTSLVARKDGKVIAFLFGFIRFGEGESLQLWGEAYARKVSIESQILGVLPDYRKLGLGYSMKRAQGLDARAQGIDIVYWTVDPLQAANASLNFRKLGGVSLKFVANYYSFQNALNQVAASRFEISWLVNSERVCQRINENNIPQMFDPAHISHSHQIVSLDNIDQAQSPDIAIEIPSDWTQLQALSIESARKWREHSDPLFAQLIGAESGKYVVTGISGNRLKSYLLARVFHPTSYH